MQKLDDPLDFLSAIGGMDDEGHQGDPGVPEGVDPSVAAKMGADLDGIKQDLAATLGKVRGLGQAEVCDIPVDRIKVLPQVRRRFDDQEVSELADSIREHGLLSPISVRRDPDGGWTLIAGEKRLRACRDKLGLSTIRANAFTIRDVPGLSSESEILVLQIIENLHRSKPDTEDLVAAVAELRRLNSGIDAKSLAGFISKSYDYTTVLIRLSDLSPDEQEALLPLGARAIARFYLSLKGREPGIAATFCRKAAAALKETGPDSGPDWKKRREETASRLIRELERLHARAGREKGADKPADPVRMSLSAVKLNKSVPGLGARFRAYLERTGLDASDAVASAVSEWLDREEGKDGA